jgi:hypothetical protein
VASKTLPIGLLPQAAERFSALYIENPPFILEKRQILLQGSLSVGMAGEAQRF